MSERKKIEKELKESQEKFLTVFQESPLALTLTSASDHRYIEVNDSFERATGWKRNEVLGRTPFDIELWVDPNERIGAVKRLLSGSTVRNLELRIRMKNREVRTCLASATLVEVNSETCVLALTADITDLRRAEESLLAAVSAPVMIWMSGVDRLCTYLNQPWLDFTGRSLEEQIGEGWTTSIHPDDLKRFLGSCKDAFDRRESYHAHYRLRRHDGEYRWILVSAVPRFNEDNSFAGYIGGAVDVTEVKLGDVALPSLGRRFLESQEEERTSIARELQDYVERLVLLSVHLDRFQQHPTEAMAAGWEIGEARQQIEDLVSDIQTLSDRLYSSKLRYLGLAAAAASFCKEFSDQRRIEIGFACEGPIEEVPQEVSLSIYRVLQEALQNVAVKYSGSQSLQVLLRGGPNGLQLTLSNIVSGLDLKGAPEGPGLGLAIINERLKLVGGEMSIESQPDSGTTIHIRIPYHYLVNSTEAGARDGRINK